MLCKTFTSSCQPYLRPDLPIPTCCSSLLCRTIKNFLSQTGTNFLPDERIQSSAASSYVISFFCSNALKFCARMGLLSGGEQLHSCTIKLGFCHRISIQTHLLNVYTKRGSSDSARQLFEEMPRKTIVSWNIIISAYAGHNTDTDLTGGEVQNNHPVSCISPNNNLGLFFFKRLLLEMVKPDHITLIGVLSACVGLDNVITGKQVHSLIIKYGYLINGFVCTAVADLYAKFGFVEDARAAFDEIHRRDLVAWNVMISCYASNGFGEEAFEIFELMRSDGEIGDRYTCSSLLNSACYLGSGELGKQIHGLIVKLRNDWDVYVGSALVDMYSKIGNMDEACKVFDLMSVRNVVSWNALILGFGRNCEGKEPMILLRKMLLQGLKPDELTFATILSCCANSGAVTEASQTHSFLLKKGMDAFLSVGNALICAYAKCGSIHDAFQSFNLISKPDLITMTSMISAYAFHGLGKEAITLFEKMLQEGAIPDGIAFVSVLSACAHAGLVDVGLRCFDLMTKGYLIKPGAEHYACLVDLIGRAGYLNEAYEILTTMPFELDTSVVGAFLHTCKVHGNTRLAEWAADVLFSLEPDKAANYMLMSNTYAAVGCWDEVARVRKRMKKTCDAKFPGCSWIEIACAVHIFASNDKSHSQATAMYFTLKLLLANQKDAESSSISDFSSSYDLVG